MALISDWDGSSVESDQSCCGLKRLIGRGLRVCFSATTRIPKRVEKYLDSVISTLEVAETPNRVQLVHWVKENGTMDEDIGEVIVGKTIKLLSGG